MVHKLNLILQKNVEQNINDNRKSEGKYLLMARDWASADPGLRLAPFSLFLQRHVQSVVNQDDLCSPQWRWSDQDIAWMGICMYESRVEDLMAERCDHLMSHLQ